MNKLILCKDHQTMLDLQSKGCKFLYKQGDNYILINSLDKLKFEEYKDKIIITDRMSF